MIGGEGDVEVEVRVSQVAGSRELMNEARKPRHDRCMRGCLICFACDQVWHVNACCSK
jgi:hypothetical protein